jgi:hypothetical protein
MTMTNPTHDFDVIADNVVRFPARRRVLDRLGLNRSPTEAELAALDAEIHRIDNSLRALSERRRAVMAAYRNALHGRRREGQA